MVTVTNDPSAFEPFDLYSATKEFQALIDQAPGTTSCRITLYLHDFASLSADDDSLVIEYNWDQDSKTKSYSIIIPHIELKNFGDDIYKTKHQGAINHLRYKLLELNNGV